jgi:hypothetical protein
MKSILLAQAAASFAVAGALAQSPPAEPKPPQDLISQDRLMAALRELPTKRAALGDDEDRAGLRKTESLIQQKLTALGYTPQMQEFRWAVPARHWAGSGAAAEGPMPDDAPASDKPGTAPGAPQADQADHTWHNIIVDIPGRELPNEIVLIGAHFDAVPGAPGADDNGTGTATLLEMARVLQDHPTKRTIRLVFFNLEECPLVGCTEYVRLKQKDWQTPAATNEGEQPQPREKVVGMVSLEMLGYFSDEPGSQKSPLPPVKGVFEPPTVGDGIAVVGIKRDQGFIAKLVEGMHASAPDLKLTVVDFLPVPIPDMTRSDHRPFMLAGIPAVMITDTANFRNPNYHSPTDTIETLDARRFTLVAKAVAGAAYQLAQPMASRP